ncbi:hypothetical protein A3C59_00310 [Candidatus Daviesbacteria bacterium RIFCSPHIGHO2_02_FULL_36_13]|uniref:Phosphatidic acid phosphatase type 2/haloperoxidase domain-containing protein n=1 Tax=Candidatus Daviesbacteria bacterium RIFCSPHIGHO2_02_FULL_36_13 TaxID=1797768 RepID=A0A1F5JU39_9BACT|nr:MAG: hypothetical protein A3C59_00310 [Candidatus Daviesbacteria bacterium RIFCSPHIGHO2_02_FULL_36_13]OGE41928.1 MAG: hypothetical protein A3A45_00490 [Candidatus Daviesbacteria bacterium RIFCSPLOWO2_01_FULL_36_8]
MRVKLFLATIILLSAFTLFSYIVAKERFLQIDFDTTVKIQDRIPRRYDEFFSYFSFLGSAEVTVAICLALSLFALARRRLLEIFGWLMIVPATVAEIFGKLVLFHPGPPVFMHRTLIATHLPSFYVHTDFSYPSGHVTRTIFIITIFSVLIIFSKKSFVFKIVALSPLFFLGFMMAMTRVYLGEHWLSDVIGGALLGAGAAFFACLLILKEGKAKILDDARGR